MSEIRDPVHGFIKLEDTEISIIDSPVFQRLRKIKQLALANLLYPGALHTRFEHSLGVMHVAAKMAEAMGFDPDEIRIVRLAGLVHDIGHGPFSHVSENLLSKFAEPALIERQGLEEIHELITMQLIVEKVPLSDLDREKIVGIILSEEENKRRAQAELVGVKDRPPDPAMKQIVSGPLDADKQDYLLRDSYFCGVKYGVFDIGRLHNTLASYNIDEYGARDLSVEEDGVNTVEQYVMAKYYMNTQIYRHRLRLITDAMITRALELGIEVDKIGFLKDLYSYDGERDFVENYSKWDDERLAAEIMSQKEGAMVREIFERLARRELYKRIYRKRIDEFGPETRDVLSRPDFEGKKRIEEKIADELGEDPARLIVNIYKIKSARKHVEGSEGDIQIKHKGKFHEESTLFGSIDQAMEGQYVEVYGPFEFNSPRDKSAKLKKWDEKINEVIEQAIGGGANGHETSHAGHRAYNDC